LHCSPTPEPDPLDLQPAFRAEAIDTFILTKLTFLFLHEWRYIPELVAEEGMVLMSSQSSHASRDIIQL